MKIVSAEGPEALDLAEKFLRKCEVIVFPTETVYGLGALPLCEKAIERMYTLKSREHSKPFLLHLPQQIDVKTYVKDSDAKFSALIKKFWPGSLSLIVKASPQVPSTAVTKDGTVGLRMPSEEFFVKLSERVGPILATSANLSGLPPAVTIEEAFQQFKSMIPLYVDAGKRKSNKASTVLDLTKSPPRILRVGAISVLQIEKVIGKVEIR